MTSQVGVNGFWYKIPEHTLVGVLCAFSLSPAINDNSSKLIIEVSSPRMPLILPNDLHGQWISKDKINIITNFSKFLQEKNGSSPIITIDSHDKENKFYIEEKYHYEFLGGVHLFDILLGHHNNNDNSYYHGEYCIGYKDNWSVNQHFLQNAKLINTPKDGLTLNKIHSLKVPTYLWDIKVNNDTYFEQLASNLVNLFLRDCHDEDHVRLTDGKSYLRFYLYQDTPISNPYVYAYIRNIDDCQFPSQIEALKATPTNELPCEILNGNMGYFWKFSLDDWNRKCVKHICSFD